MTSIQIAKSRIRSRSQIRGTRFFLRFNKAFSFWSHTCISAFDHNSLCAVPYARHHLHIPIAYDSEIFKKCRWFIPIDPLLVCLFVYFFGTTVLMGPRSPWGYYISHNWTHNHPIGFLWTSDKLIAETSTWQNTIFTTDRYPCPWWDSNPRSKQANGRRPTP